MYVELACNVEVCVYVEVYPRCLNVFELSKREGKQSLYIIKPERGLK